MERMSALQNPLEAKPQNRSEHLQVLAQKGIRLLAPEEIHTMSAQFAEEVQRGIESNSQDPQGIKMYRSHIAPRSAETILPKDVSALVVEVGGTNAYAAIVESDGNGNARIAKDEQGEDLNIKSPLRPKTEEGRLYTDADDFFNELVEKMSPLVSKSPKVSGLGVVYSFPGAAKAFSAHHVDVQSAPLLPKDFVIPGISEKVEGNFREPRYIGESLLAAIKVRYPDLFVEGDIPIVVGNDTVAVGLSQAGSKIGGIVGTGFNYATAAQVEGELQYVNTEAGASASVPETEIFQQLGWSNSQRSINPAERQISGAGIGDILDYSAHYLVNENMLPSFQVDATTLARKKLTPETVTALLENNQEVSDMFVRPLTTEEFDTLRAVADTLTRRSAQITGTMLGTLAKVFPDVFTESELFVPMEGSIFWKVPGYKELVAQSAHDITPNKTYSFGDSEPKQAGTRGIGAAVLANIK